MAKKNRKQSSAKVVTPRIRTHVFRKEAKVEPIKDTIKGTVYFALKALKSGTTEQVHERALKNGLADLTGQDTRVQTLVMIQRLRQEGIVATEKPEGSKPAPKADAKKKVVVKKAATKKVSPKKSKLKVVPKADAADESEAATL